MPKAKDDKNNELPKYEDFLAPWEIDSEGKKLEEPVDIDPERLKKHLYNLLSDKVKLQGTVEDRDTELAQAKDALTTLQREHEDEDQRRERENREREQRYAQQEKELLERKKIEAIEEAFEDQGITAARARRLAKRIPSDVPEDQWVAEARELVEDGFRISDKTTTVVEEDDSEDTFSARPKKVVRSDGRQAEGAQKPKFKSVAEELDAAGVTGDGWG